MFPGQDSQTFMFIPFKKNYNMRTNLGSLAKVKLQELSE